MNPSWLGAACGRSCPVSLLDWCALFRKTLLLFRLDVSDTSVTRADLAAANYKTRRETKLEVQVDVKNLLD